MAKKKNSSDIHKLIVFFSIIAIIFFIIIIVVSNFNRYDSSEIDQVVSEYRCKNGQSIYSEKLEGYDLFRVTGNNITLDYNIIDVYFSDDYYEMLCSEKSKDIYGFSNLYHGVFWFTLEESEEIALSCKVEILSDDLDVLKTNEINFTYEEFNNYLTKYKSEFDEEKDIDVNENDEYNQDSISIYNSNDDYVVEMDILVDGDCYSIYTNY